MSGYLTTKMLPNNAQRRSCSNLASLMLTFCTLMLTFFPVHAAIAEENRISIARTTTMAAISSASPAILTVANAKRFHTHALAEARRIERSRGHFQVLAAIPTSYATATAQGLSTTVRPIDYGADPTGKLDSTHGFERAMTALLKLSRTHSTMAAGIADLGGATLDLTGGKFLISRPLHIPPMFGNLHVRDGSLHASEAFPPHQHLINIGNASTCKPLLPSGKPDPQDSCNEFISLSNLLLDARLIAAGGMRIGKVMGTTITSCFVVGFVETGIQIDRGHEVMVSESWLAACYWSEDDTACRRKAAEAVGVLVDGNDHVLRNVIVFDFARVGVKVLGAANLLTGVHTWNGGGVGIELGNHTSSYGAHQNRLIGCYLDYDTLDMYSPSQTVVQSTFFLETHANIFRVGNESRADSDGMHDVAMQFNTFSSNSTNETVSLHGSLFAWTSGNVRVSDSLPNTAKSTRAKRTITLTNATESAAANILRFEFDFSDILLLPGRIDSMVYSVASLPANEVAYRHSARQVSAAPPRVYTDSRVGSNSRSWLQYLAAGITVDVVAEVPGTLSVSVTVQVDQEGRPR